jgi:hypothetical protein
MSENIATINPEQKSRILLELKDLAGNKNYLHSALRYCEQLKDEYCLTNDELVLLVKEAWAND